MDCPEGQRSSKDSNNLLFSLLFEELHATYQRQIRLSQQQSQFFFDNLSSRSRSADLFPFPFRMDKFVGSSTVEKDTDRKQTQSHSSSKDIGPRLSPGQKGTVPAGQDHVSDEKQVPEWNCFMKAVNNTALMLVFLPASFDDLVLLNEKTQEETNDDKTASDEEIKEPDQRREESCDKDDPLTKSEAESADKTLDCATAECDIDTTTKGSSNVETVQDQDTCDKDASESTHGELTEDTVMPQCGAAGNMIEDDLNEMPKENEHKDDERENRTKPLTLPVYIYDCIIHNVLDSLINPWDFQLPSDTYQDMMFDFQEEPQDFTGRIKRVSFSIDNLKVYSKTCLKWHLSKR